MSELKAKNKELEKFKFVLDYKLRELRKEIEPCDEQIGGMRDTIKELDDELQVRHGGGRPKHLWANALHTLHLSPHIRPRI